MVLPPVLLHTHNTTIIDGLVPCAIIYVTVIFCSDLDLAWKMLHIAKAILEKSPCDPIVEVLTYCSLAEVSMERGSFRLPFILITHAFNTE